MKNLLFISPDSVTEALQATGLLQALAERHPGLKTTVACPDEVRFLYEHGPCVRATVSWRPDQLAADAGYRAVLAERLGGVDADTCIHARTRRDAASDALALASKAPELIAHDVLDAASSGGRRFTRLVPRPDAVLLESQHHRNLLRLLGIEVERVMPQVWTQAADAESAQSLLVQHGLQPEKTLAILTSPSHPLAVYERFAEALKPLCAEHDFRVLLLGAQPASAAGDKFSGLPVVDLRGRASLMVCAELLRCSRLAVGLEGPLAHVACAVGCPNVIVLGGGQFGRYMPYSPLTSGIFLPLSCLACNWKCVHPEPYCATLVFPEIIEAAVRETLAQSSDVPRTFLQDMSFGVVPVKKLLYMNPDRFPAMLYQIVAILPDEVNIVTQPPGYCGYPVRPLQIRRRTSKSLRVLGRNDDGYMISFDDAAAQ